MGELKGGGPTSQRELAETVIDEAEAEEPTDFMRGYVMGACVMAGVLGLPPDVWAHPEREARRRAAGKHTAGSRPEGRE